MARWTFTDPTDSSTYTLEINPSAMSQGPDTPNLTSTLPASPIDGRIRARRTPKTPNEWQFSGIINTFAERDALQTWYDKSQKVTLVDHLGRTFTVRFKNFDPTSKRPTHRTSWRFTYTATVLVYAGPN